MQIVLPGMVILLSFVLPLGLLAWAFFTRAKTRLYLASIFLLAALVLAILAQSFLGFSHVFGWFWPIVFAVLLAIIAIYRGVRGVPHVNTRGEAVASGLTLTLAALCAVALVRIWQAHSYEGQPLRLASPLRGTLYVVTGGSNAWTNQHAMSPGNTYALDLTVLNAFGAAATGFYPSQLSAYAAFGKDVLAPCAGEVIDTANDKPNQAPLHPDGNDGAGGNHVTIYCQGHSVLLAHMQPGSVNVAIGDQVRVGQTIGKVGSSGNAMEPHLHIDAVPGRRRYDRQERAANGPRTIPILIDGRFLVKGDMLESK